MSTHTCWLTGAQLKAIKIYSLQCWNRNLLELRRLYISLWSYLGHVEYK